MDMDPVDRDTCTAEPSAHEPHRLWWRPGDGHGRGILFRSGHVHTWPEAEGEHRHMAELRPEPAAMFFLIRPDGGVRIPRRHAELAAELTDALSAADGRLRPFNPHGASDN
jgi:hypothetical protein